MRTRTIAGVGLALAWGALGAAGCTSGGADDPDAGPDGAADADGDADTDADGDTDADSDECEPVDELPWLTPADIDFLELDEPLGGSFIYYGTWATSYGQPDALEMITPDGVTTGVRFEVHRLWSFGVAHDGITVAFSSLDPLEEEHWCVTMGDAIQYTWLFADGADPVQITSGPHNDECHRFGPDDTELYLCRRDNFWQQVADEELQFGNDPYRILVHDLATHAETWLTPLDEQISDIGPALRDDGTILFWRQEAPSFDQSLMSMDADGGNVATLLADATNPVTSPDGAAVLYRDQWRRLMHGPSADPGAATLVVDGGDDFILDYDFSPDLARVAYTRGREDASCSDLWVAGIDGSDQTRLIDCVADAKFVTGVQWVEVD